MIPHKKRRRYGKRREDPKPVKVREWDDSFVYKPKHSDFDRVWAEHQRLAYKAAHLIGRERHIAPDELIGTLVLKFNWCLYYYDPARGKFSTFFWGHLRHFLDAHFLRHDSEHRDAAYFARNRQDKDWLNVLKEYEYHEGGFRLYRVPDRDDDWTSEIIGEFNTVKECWEFFVRGLHPRYRQVIEMVYGMGINFAEVAEDFGVTRERVRQIHNKALEHTRTRLRVLEKFIHLFPANLLED